MQVIASQQSKTLERKQELIVINRSLHYSGHVFFGVVGLVSLLSVTLIISNWSGVLEYLLGA
jgi:hypothetical protein